MTENERLNQHAERLGRLEGINEEISNRRSRQSAAIELNGGAEDHVLDDLPCSFQNDVTTGLAVPDQTDSLALEARRPRRLIMDQAKEEIDVAIGCTAD